MRRLAPVLALVLLAAAAPPAAADAVRREVLPNGLTVLVRENPVAPAVAVSLMLRMGTRWETADNAGISNFVQALMLRGTTRRSGGDLAEAVTALGGKLSASGEVDYSEIKASALARFWRELLALTAELALEPRLAAADVDSERDWLLSRVQRRQDGASSRAFDTFYASLYGPHPYGLVNLGTPASLRRIDHAALVAWYRRFYQPGRMVLAVSGQVSAGEVLAEVTRLFGGLPRGGEVGEPRTPAVMPPVQRPAESRRVVVDHPAAQVQIVSGGLAPALDHPDHAAAKVLATILGGGMAGRLFVELRDKAALAYTATSFFEPTREPGALILYLGSAPDTAARAEEGLTAQVARIRDVPVGAEELARAKAYLLGKYAMDRRTNERQAWYLAHYEVQGVGLAYPERYRRAVDAVTAADVQRVARQALGAPVTVVLRPPAR